MQGNSETCMKSPVSLNGRRPPDGRVHPPEAPVSFIEPHGIAEGAQAERLLVAAPKGSRGDSCGVGGVFTVGQAVLEGKIRMQELDF